MTRQEAGTPTRTGQIQSRILGRTVIGADSEYAAFQREKRSLPA
jgi:hypothetical protein